MFTGVCLQLVPRFWCNGNPISDKMWNGIEWNTLVHDKNEYRMFSTTVHWIECEIFIFIFVEKAVEKKKRAETK